MNTAPLAVDVVLVRDSSRRLGWFRKSGSKLAPAETVSRLARR